MKTGDLGVLEFVRGEVVGVEPFGVFVALDDGRTAVLEFVHFENGPPSESGDDYPQVGTRIEAVVLQVVRGQPRLSMRPKDMAQGRKTLEEG